MTRTFFQTFERDDGETEITVEYSISDYLPAQTYGPPESCCPAEGGEVEIVKAWTTAEPSQDITLTDAEEQRMSTYIQENPPPDDDYDPYDF
ncbi:MAG: hypothetical protein WDN46_07690 [Methylocella sp.]